MITLNEVIINEVKEHARKEFPRECCGLLAIIKGKQHYYPCKNIATNDSDFILDPLDYVIIEDFVKSHAGDIAAVIHSHPVSSSDPTMIDQKGCEMSGLQWVIYSPKYESWHYFKPNGYRAPLFGRPFKHGVFDCYSAVKDWYATKGIFLPEFEREELWWQKGQDIILENFEKAGFKRVDDGSIKENDGLLITHGSQIVNHCAVYIGNDQVFHQTMNRLSGREIYGGLLKKNTRMVIRYQR